MGNEIRQYREHGKEYTSAVSFGRRIHAIDTDNLRNFLYWVDSSTNQIQRTFLPSTPDLGTGEPQELEVSATGRVEDIAVDWVAR